MKKLLISFILGATLLLPISAKAMKLPSHSLIIGNVAYSLDYVVNPKHQCIVNNMIQKENNKPIYYYVKDNVIKDMTTNQYVQDNLFIDNYYWYIDKDGNAYISFDGLADFEPLK